MRSHSIGAGAGRGLLQMIVKPRYASQVRKFSEKTRNTPYSHFSAIEMEGFKTLKEGERVKFALEKGPKGLLALRIRTARSSNPEVEAEAA